MPAKKKSKTSSKKTLKEKTIEIVSDNQSEPEITEEINVPSPETINWKNRIQSVVSDYMQNATKFEPLPKYQKLKEKKELKEVEKPTTSYANPEKGLAFEVVDNNLLKDLSSEPEEGKKNLSPIELLLEKMAKLEEKLSKKEKKKEKKRKAHKRKYTDLDEDSDFEQDTKSTSSNPFEPNINKEIPIEDDVEDEDSNPFSQPTNKSACYGSQNSFYAKILNHLEEWFLIRMKKNLWDYPGLSGYPSFKIELVSRASVGFSSVIRLWNNFVFPGEKYRFEKTRYTQNIDDFTIHGLFDSLAHEYKADYGYNVPSVVGMIIIHCFSHFGEIDHLFGRRRR